MKWNAAPSPGGFRMWTITDDAGNVIERDLTGAQAKSLAAEHNACIDIMVDASHTIPVTVAACA